MPETPLTQKTVCIGTDVANLMVFHPSDLIGREDWPIAWWGACFAYAPLAETGHLLAFGTGSDGGYVVRLAHVHSDGDALSPEEQSRLVMSFDARCEVRHGGVYLTNDDALPGEESRPNGELSQERFLALPDGLYRIRVHDLELSAVRAKRKLTDDDADFVISFVSVDRTAFNVIRPAHEPPRMRPAGKDGRPSNADRMYGAVSLTEHQRAFLLRAEEDSGSIQPRKAVYGGGSFLRLPTVGAVVLPGESLSFDVSKQWFDVFRTKDPWSRFVVLAPAADAGSLAMVCWIRGSSEHFARNVAPARLVVEVRGCFPIRLTRPNVLERAMRWFGLEADRSRSEPECIPRIDLSPGTVPVLRRDEGAPDLDVSDLRARIISLIDSDTPGLGRRPKSPSYETAAMAAADDSVAILDWLLRHLDIPSQERLALWPEPIGQRARVLVAKLRSLT